MSILSNLETTFVYLSLREKMNHNLVDFLYKHALAGKANNKIAEVACGSGYAAHLLAGFSGISLSVAADISSEYYDRTPMENFAAEFILSDIFKPPVQMKSFDLVWNSSSIEELEDSQGALDQMAGMVRPGGYVYVGIPFKFGPMAVLKAIPNDNVQTWLGKTFSKAEMRTMFEKSGLKVERTRIYMGGIFLGVLGKKI